MAAEGCLNSGRESWTKEEDRRYSRESCSDSIAQPLSLSNRKRVITVKSLVKLIFVGMLLLWARYALADGTTYYCPGEWGSCRSDCYNEMNQCMSNCPQNGSHGQICYTTHWNCIPVTGQTHIYNCSSTGNDCFDAPNPSCTQSCYSNISSCIAWCDLSYCIPYS
jgi:hypothetical protein